jgi:hypothetical protein
VFATLSRLVDCLAERTSENCMYRILSALAIASTLAAVLDGNPLEDWNAIRRIKLRVKQGATLRP